MASASSSTDSVISSTTRRGSMPGARQDRGHRGDRGRVEHLAGGEVHARSARSARSPPARRPARAPTSPSARWRRSPRRAARRTRGRSSPRCGCCQRTSASWPSTVERAEVDDRLEVHDHLTGLDRAPARRPPARGGRRRWCASGARRARRGPCRWPWRRTSRGRRPAARPRPTRRSPLARPRLALIAQVAPGHREGHVERRQHPLGDAAGPPRSPCRPRRGWRTRRRRSGPRCRRGARRPAAARPPTTSRRSPASCPRLSLTVLKSSRSTNSTRDRVVAALLRARGRGDRGTALGWRGAVSGSWNAWNSSSPSRSRSSATVRSRWRFSSRFSRTVTICRATSSTAMIAPTTPRNGPMPAPGRRPTDEDGDAGDHRQVRHGDAAGRLRERARRLLGRRLHGHARGQGEQREAERPAEVGHGVVPVGALGGQVGEHAVGHGERHDAGRHERQRPGRGAGSRRTRTATTTATVTTSATG